VVNADGLVGRVVAVSPWTADVLLVGAGDLTVSVRVGAGVLGSVGSGAQGPRRQAPGELTLTPVQRGVLSRGDVVTTLGSLGGTPYPPGLRVGTVTEVDGDPAALVPTAGVAPAADVATLDVVGVLVGPARTTPRSPSTGGG
jgi:rod shape-determining protein MreC